MRLSEAAYRDVSDRLDIRFADLGTQRLRNIARPVRIYAVPSPEAAVSRVRLPRPVLVALAALLLAGLGLAGTLDWPHVAPRRQESLSPSVSRIPSGDPARPPLSLVVLPLANQSGDPEQDYLAEQIAEDLSADLARAPGTFVIAHGTARSFEGRPVEPRAVGRELGVRYVVQGSLRHSAEQVRFAVQLTDVETGAALWADRFDGTRADLAAAQDALVAQVGRTLGIRLLEAETQGRAGHPADAVDLVMRGQALLNRPFARENHAGARPLFERALALDPGNTHARLGLAEVLVDGVLNGWTGERETDLHRAEQAVAAVLQGDPTHPFGHYLRGETLRARARYEEALAAFDRVLALNPSFARAHAYRGLIHIFLGRAEETEADIAAAFRLSPKDPLVGAWLARDGLAKLHLGRDEAAIPALLRAAAVNPLFDFPHLYLACAYARLGREAEARASSPGSSSCGPATRSPATARSPPAIRPSSPSASGSYDGLRRAGLPER